MERLRRVVAGYAAKLISKANLLHLFGRLSLRSLTNEIDAPFEVLKAQDAAVSESSSDDVTEWSLAPLIARESATLVLLLQRGGALQIARVPRSALLDALYTLTSASGRCAVAQTLDEAIAQILATPTLARRIGIIDALTRHGILTPTASRDSYITRWCGIRSLPRVRGAAEIWVNAYAPLPTDNVLASHSARTMRLVRRIIQSDDTLSVRRILIRAWLTQRIGKNPVPLLQLLPEFLADFEHVVSDKAASPEALEILAARARRAATARNVSGDVAIERLAQLMGADATTDAERPILAIGAYSVQRALFYPHQFLYGDGRFLGRFAVSARQREVRRQAQIGPLKVEVAVASPPALHRVVPTFAIGAGFDHRLRSSFDTWVELEDIAAAWDRDSLHWIRRSDGRPLHFQYRGFSLTQFLPAQHQLLLIDQVDRYENPFTAESAQGDGIEHLPSLSSEGVMLRRETWHVAVSTLRTLVPSHLETAALMLRARRALRDTLGVDGDEWFVMLHGGADRRDSHKPRYLDLLSPPSLRDFSHAIWRAGAPHTMSLTMMAPSREEVVAGPSEGVVQEWMVDL